jgi:hypothetical protein
MHRIRTHLSAPAHARAIEENRYAFTPCPHGLPNMERWAVCYVMMPKLN